MPAVATYSAGTAFLSVVPSFLNIEQAMAGELKKMGKNVENTVKESLPKGMAEGAKRAKEHGDKAGADYSGAFGRTAKKDLTEAFKSIAIPEPGVKLTKWDKAMLHVRKDIRELSQETIGTTIDEKTASKAIDNLRGRLQGLRDTAPIGRDTGFFNARAADNALARLTALGEDARRRGAQVAEEFAGAYNTRVQKLLSDGAKAIPALKPEVEASDARKSLEDLRQRMEALGKRTIGVDITADDAFTEIKRLEEEFKALDHQNIEVDVRTNARTAAAGMSKLIDENEVRKSAQQIADETAAIFASGFTDGVKKVLDNGLKKLPAIPLKADPSDAERELDQLRKDMEELSSKTIGVHISAGEAYAEIKRIESELRNLDREGVDVDVRVNARGAAGGMTQFIDETELRKQAEQVAKDVAEAFQGSFSRQLGKVLTDGMQAIPAIHMTADNSDAERKLAALRVRMDDLSNKTIGVNIDGASALAELKLIETGLKQLDNKRVDVNVRTNAREAADGISKLISDVDKVGGAMNKAGGSVGSLMSRLGMLIALGASLGTVLVPAALAAGAALGSMGTMAAAGISGIGVFALGISGVSDAVKAMDQYQNDAAKSANNLNQAQRRMSGTADAVRQAESALANTRQNVADAAVDAARRVADAERGVADARHAAGLAAQRSAEAVENAQRNLTGAEQDARDAREALNDAYKEAARSLRDLQSQVKHNAIDQEQATIAVAKAKAELDKMMSNSRATDIERREAQASYEERVLQLEDLKNRGQDLSEQQTEANKKGIEGSTLVVAAQKRMADADEKLVQSQKALERARQDQAEQARQSARQIADAQQSVADAQRAQQQQARQGAYQLAQAEQALISAKRQEQQAWEQAGVAGGSALEKLNEKMNVLSPAAQRFAKFIFGLKDEVLNLRNAAAEPLLPGLQEAITLLLPYLPAVAQFIGKVAQQLGSMAVQAANALGSPVWQAFFSYVDETVVPSLQQMFDVGRNVAEGLVSMFLALRPFNQSVGTGLVELSRDFSQWAAKLEGSPGYEKFLNYVRENGPKVVELLGATGKALISIVEAAMPMGSVVLSILTGFMEIIDAIPTPVLQTIVWLIGGMAAALLLLNLRLKALRLAEQLSQIFSPKWATMQDAFTAAADRYAAGAGRAGVETGKFRRALDGLGGASESAYGSLTKFDDFIGGKWGGIMAVATTVIFGAIEASDKFDAKVKTLAGSLDSLSGEFRDLAVTGRAGGGEAAKQLEAIVKNNPDLARAVTQLGNLGIGFDQLTLAASGSKQQVDQVIKTLDDEISRLGALWQAQFFAHPIEAWDTHTQIQQLRQLRQAVLDNADATDDQRKAQDLLNVSEARSRELQQILNNYGPTTREVRQQITDAYSDNADKIEVLTRLVETFGNTESTAAQKADTMRFAVEKQTGAAIRANEAEETLASQMINLRDQVTQAKEAHDENATSMDMNSTTALRNRDAVQQVATSIRNMYFEDIASGVPMDKATEQHGKRIEALRQESEKLGLTTEATEELIKMYGNVDGDVKTVYDSEQFDKVYKELQRLQFIQQMIKQGKSVEEAKALFEKGNSVDQLIANLIGKADGGLIEGPWRGPEADNMVIRVNPREYVQRVDAVDYYGVDFMDALNQRRIPREILPGFARGGQIRKVLNANAPKRPGPHADYPIKVATDMAWIPTEEQAVNWAGGEHGLGTGSGPGGWQWQINVLRAAFPGLELYSAYRPGDVAESGSLSYHAKGRAVDLPPRMDVFNWIKGNYGSNTKELIFSPAGGRQVWNGREHLFSGDALVAAHYNHVHWAYDQGGMLQPGVSTVLNATGKPEPVLTGKQWDTMTALAQKATTAVDNRTNNYYFRDTTLTEAKLRAMEAAEAVRARDGRAR